MQPAECYQHIDGPNRNGSWKDLVLATKPLPSQEALRQLLRYDPETGLLFWRERTPDMFSDVDPRGSTWAANQWNSRNAGKEAFTFADRRGYRHGKVGGTLYQAHRVIWKVVHGVDPDQIDHINGNPCDNRIENLRACTVAENSRNYRKPAGSSQYRGVSWVKRDKAWAARISSGNGGKRSLGNFKDEIEAAKAYDRAAREMHGEFAVLNFPDAALILSPAAPAEQREE